MGYGAFVLPDGREAGYLIEATCDAAGCKVEIDRGFGYLCGAMPNGWRDSEEPGCGNYYCGEHQPRHGCPNPLCDSYPCPDCEPQSVTPCVSALGHDGDHTDMEGLSFTKTEEGCEE